MREVDAILSAMKESPVILRGLLKKIPEERLRFKRFPDKWTIHEHACHLAEVQPVLIERFKILDEQSDPQVQPYLPGVNIPDEHLIDMNLGEALASFTELRKELISLVNDFTDATWQRPVLHPEYEIYNGLILLRHVLMHDHLHMYRIEELWLTQDDYL